MHNTAAQARALTQAVFGASDDTLAFLVVALGLAIAINDVCATGGRGA